MYAQNLKNAKRGTCTPCPKHPCPVFVVVYYCRTYMKAVRGGGVKRGDVCYGMLRAAACVDESDQRSMYVYYYRTLSPLPIR